MRDHATQQVRCYEESVSGQAVHHISIGGQLDVHVVSELQVLVGIECEESGLSRIRDGQAVLAARPEMDATIKYGLQLVGGAIRFESVVRSGQVSGVQVVQYLSCEGRRGEGIALCSRTVNVSASASSMASLMSGTVIVCGVVLFARNVSVPLCDS